MKVLNREQVELPEAWWLDLGFRGGVEKRVGWWGMNSYWYVICFNDGTRSPRLYGTNNVPYEPPTKGQQ